MVQLQNNGMVFQLVITETTRLASYSLLLQLQKLVII